MLPMTSEDATVPEGTESARPSGTWPLTDETTHFSPLVIIIYGSILVAVASLSIFVFLFHTATLRHLP